jgi:exosome complex RNA-binding protein Csl4
MLLKVKTIFIAVHGLEEFLNFSNFLKLSLGDARAYYLSTAKNELGVVSATSDAGVAMVPINWQEMQCPVTLQKEFRKVAKVC